MAVRALKQEQDAAYEMSLEQDKQKDVPKPNTSSGVSGPCGSTTVHPRATTSSEQSSNVQTVTAPPVSESSRQAPEEVRLPSSFSDSPASTESNTENAPSDSDLILRTQRCQEAKKLAEYFKEKSDHEMVHISVNAEVLAFPKFATYRLVYFTLQEQLVDLRETLGLHLRPP